MKKINLRFIYNHFEEILLVTLFAVMVSVIFIQVIMRYVFDNSLSWSEELGRFVFEWLTWIGISLGARVGQHIKITMLVDKFSYKGAHAANVVSEIIVVVICVLTIYYGVEISRMFIGSHFTTIKISLAWGYASVVVGCGLVTIRSLATIKKSMIILISGGSKAKMEEGGMG